MLIGVLGTCLAYSVSRAASDAVAFRDKLTQLPDPSVLVTKNLIDERVGAINQRIDDSNRDTKESLRRIEGKIDSLTFSLAIGRDDLKKQTSVFPPMVVPPVSPDSTLTKSRLHVY